VCAAAFLTFTCAESRADVFVRGGSTDQQHRIHAIYESQLPAEWQTVFPVHVNILTDDSMNAYIRGGSDEHMRDGDTDDAIDGIYEDGPPTITLRGSIDRDALPFTFAHEYGHFFWQNGLTQADRSRYTALYGQQKRAHHLVTDYAAADVHEGFAEAFSYYVMERQILSYRDERSCEFLDNVLNRYRLQHPTR
jgi:hypothetical protein